jgi:hypothetical protein
MATLYTVHGERKLQDSPGGQTLKRKSFSVFQGPELARGWPIGGSLLSFRRLEVLNSVNQFSVHVPQRRVANFMVRAIANFTKFQKFS